MTLSEHANYPRQRQISRRSAEIIVPLVQDLVSARSVVDVGCGVGAWLSVFQDQGVEDILGLDGDWVPREDLCISEELFQSTDVRKPLGIERKYDLAVSLEVGEHLDERYASTFVASLCELAPVVLFSAAIPKQGGPGHVNERWPDYWAELFSSHGFEAMDPIRGQVWDNEEVCWWFAQNILMYARPDAIAANPKLAAASAHTNRKQLSLVHPKKYLQGPVSQELQGSFVRRVYWKLRAKQARRRSRVAG